MCGIVGYLDSKPDFHVSLSEMVDCLVHRGPDQSGEWTDSEQGVGLGHARLSILDLSEIGRQPMVSADNRYRIVYNGEIYNYRELRQELQKEGWTFATETDTEVILEGFAAWGGQLFSRMRGMFAFAIWDSVAQKLTLCRDRFGIKPLYIYRDKNLLIFASELRAIVAHPSFNTTIRRSAISEYLTFGSVQEPGTIYDGVSALAPGTFVEFSSDLSAKHEEFYSFDDSISAPPLNIDYSEARHLVRTALEEASKYHIIADVEVGAFLSGGIDSTAVVALMQQQSGKPIKTFTVGFEADQGAIDESGIAEKAAIAIGTEHHRIRVSSSEFGRYFENFIAALDQPSSDGVNTFIVSQAAAQEVKVCLSGLGGDEIFGGYTFYPKAMSSIRGPDVFRSLVKLMHGIRPNRFTMNRIAAGLLESDSVLFFRSGGRLYRCNTQDQSGRYTPLQQISRSEISGYLRNTLLRDSDVMSMAHSLELRPILLDHPLVELALSLPDQFKIQDGTMKKVFRDAVQDLIPREILSFPKNGFVLPYARWFNLSQREIAMDLERSSGMDFLIDSGFVTKSSRRSFRQRIQRGCAAGDDYRLFILLAWLAQNSDTLR